MVALTEILIAEVKDKNPCDHCGGETQIPGRTARFHACSHVHSLISPVCRRGRAARYPIGYQDVINLYGFVNSPSVGKSGARAHSSLSFSDNFVKGWARS